MQEKLLTFTQQISKKLSKKLTFDIYEPDDIEQEIYLLILKAAPKYDSSKGAEYDFYYNFVKRRLLTLQRDKGINAKTKRSDQKAKILGASTIGTENEACYESNLAPQKLEDEDYLESVVDKKIPARLRLYYLRMMSGVEVSYHNKTKVMESIRIIKDANKQKN